MERAHMAQIPNLMPPQQLGNLPPQIVLCPHGADGLGGTQLELAADLGLILTQIGAV